MNILSVRNLKKYYNTGENTVKALDGIDLDICKGEFLAVVGTSGSGKSTLLHMLGGLDNPTSGEVIIDGKNISGLSRDELTVYRRRKIGFVFQNYNLLPLMNVYENIVLPIKLDGIKPDSFTCRVVGIDEVEFEKINNTLQTPLDKEKFKNGEIAFVSKNFTQGDNGITEKKVEFSIPTALNPDKKEIVETGAIIDDYPAYYSAGYTPDLIVSDDFFDKIMGQPLIEMIKIDYDEPFSKNVESSIKKLVANNKLISAESKLDNYSEMKNSENQITVLGGSLGIIIMLLAISNYLNMMSESIQNRSKEFAILESVGMTRKQIKKVIVFESLGYSVLSIVIALILGLPASYLIFTNFNIYGIPYVFPVIKTLLLFITIIIVCVVTSLFVFSKSKSETVIELLRKDEV